MLTLEDGWRLVVSGLTWSMKRTILLAFVIFLASGPFAGAQESCRTDEEELAPIELIGKRVFEDKTLSRPAGVACASCHQARQAYQGNNGSPIAAVARGAVPHALGKRNTPTIMYASFSPPFNFVEERDARTGHSEMIPLGGQFHDGRAATLTEQVAGPLFDPNEMNAASKKDVVERIRLGPYADLLRRVFDENIFNNSDEAFVKLSQAVAAFESSSRFHPFSSKFDDYLRGKAELSPLERKGFILFKDPKKGNCLSCHVGKEDSRNPQDWLFTDFTYDALGGPKNKQLMRISKPDLGLCEQPELVKKIPLQKDRDSFCGAFKVPTLRNIAQTSPYLHNGFFTKLRDVVAFYATRDTQPARWFPRNSKGLVEKFNDLPRSLRGNVNITEAPYDRGLNQSPRLSEGEISAITAFLATLTDHEKH